MKTFLAIALALTGCGIYDSASATEPDAAVAQPADAAACPTAPAPDLCHPYCEGRCVGSADTDCYHHCWALCEAGAGGWTP